MTGQRLWLVLLVTAGSVLAFVALRAPEPTYVAPQGAQPVAVPLALTQAARPGHVARFFDVQGICCQGCGGKLHGALMALDGVQEVAVDPLRGEVSAWVRADVDDQRLAAALTFDKYSARAR